MSEDNKEMMKMVAQKVYNLASGEDGVTYIEITKLIQENGAGVSMGLSTSDFEPETKFVAFENPPKEAYLHLKEKNGNGELIIGQTYNCFSLAFNKSN